jgi:hypothetical protein
MDLLVTTPKNRIQEAAEEAERAKREGGYYFRKFRTRPQHHRTGERIFYVMDGFIRGYARSFFVLEGPRKVTVRYKDLDPKIIWMKTRGRPTQHFFLHSKEKLEGPDYLTRGILRDYYHEFSEGWWVLMNVASWIWIRPFPLRGFQGWKYIRPADVRTIGTEKAGGWLDPMPEIPKC